MIALRPHRLTAADHLRHPIQCSLTHPVITTNNCILDAISSILRLPLRCGVILHELCESRGGLFFIGGDYALVGEGWWWRVVEGLLVEVLVVIVVLVV